MLIRWCSWEICWMIPEARWFYTSKEVWTNDRRKSDFNVILRMSDFVKLMDILKKSVHFKWHCHRFNCFSIIRTNLIGDQDQLLFRPKRIIILSMQVSWSRCNDYQDNEQLKPVLNNNFFEHSNSSEYSSKVCSRRFSIQNYLLLFWK